MDAKQLAAQLDGLEYPPKFDTGLLKLARENSLVIVCGASDDLTEFYGAINDELGAWEGAIHWLTGDGLYPENECSEDDCPNYVKPNEDNAVPLHAGWCEIPGVSWTFDFAVQHETFNVMEDGGIYCIGIVFALADVATYLAARKGN